MYFITTLRVLDKVIDDCRTVGYFSSYRDAYDRVINNTCDIFEDGYYNYAVIERIGQGLYPQVQEIQWFYYDRMDHSILTVERPHVLGDRRYAPNDILGTYIG